MPDQDSTRWQGRPFASACLRLAVFATPVASAIAVSGAIVQNLPRAPGVGALAVRWLIAIAISSVVLVVVDRLMKKLSPLAVLLQLSLAFPAEAPSRFKLARQAASLRDLEGIAERARMHGITDEPAVAAERILQLVAAVEAHDRGTRGHSERVRVYTDLIAEQLKLPRRDRDRLRWAALLHDVGKLMVPPAVLNKPNKLDDDEWSIVRRHPDEGARLTGSLRAWLGEWALAIEQHHEHYDGGGYPRALEGSMISRGARIVSVADSYETMTARRPYRRPMRASRARQELVRCAGTQFDPSIVRAFLQVSVGRLRLVSGPLSWVAQMPFVGGLGHAATSGAAAAGGAALILGIVPMTTPPQPADRPVTRARAESGIDARADDGSSLGPVSFSPSSSPTSTPRPEPTLSPTPTTKPSPTPTQRPSPIVSPTPSPTLRPSTDYPASRPDPSDGT